MKSELRVNEAIVGLGDVRLIGEGGMVGVVPVQVAFRVARDAELDLVEISPNAEPPVVKVMDYGKYLYEQRKRHADQKSHCQELREIRIKSYAIGDHDLMLKVGKAREFLEKGDRVLVSLVFKGRESQHDDMGRELLESRFFGPLEDVAKVESAPRKEGRRMAMTLGPKKGKK